MPTLYQSPYGERVFAQVQPDLLTVQNSGGVWNSGGAQYIRITEDSLHISPDEPKVDPRIKHGTASSLRRITARKSASWSLNAPMCPSGIQAVPPDIDPLLQGVFGGPGTLVTGTSFGNAWAYGIYDQAIAPLTLLGFQYAANVPSGFGNRYVMGALPTRMTIDFNGNILGMNLNGVAVGAMENETFSGITDPEPKGGLGAFPGAPGSFSANGNVINAFGGSLFINGQLFSLQCDQLSVEFDTGLGLKGNFLDTAYPACAVFNNRSASVQLGFVNNNSTQLQSLKLWARQNIPVDLTFLLGSTPGMRMYLFVRGVQFVPGTLSDANGYVSCSFGQSNSSVNAGFSNDIEIGFA
jgi:hypothetical protein